MYRRLKSHLHYKLFRRRLVRGIATTPIRLMERTKKAYVLPSMSIPTASHTSRTSGSSGGSQSPRPKCKLHRTFPAIRPKGCRVKARQGASSSGQSQATQSSAGSRGSQARSESVVERRLGNERLHRNTANLITYYAKKKKQGKKSTRYVPGTFAAASYPQSSQHSRT
jgi:hypothetical protein